MTNNVQYKGTASFYGQWDKLLVVMHDEQLHKSEPEAKSAIIQHAFPLMKKIPLAYTNVVFDVVVVTVENDIAVCRECERVHGESDTELCETCGSNQLEVMDQSELGM